jgi:hypothetical protein
MASLRIFALCAWIFGSAFAAAAADPCAGQGVSDAADMHASMGHGGEGHASHAMDDEAPEHECEGDCCVDGCFCDPAPAPAGLLVQPTASDLPSASRSSEALAPFALEGGGGGPGSPPPRFI